jgi:tetratricopeptide (TPR) repeat protein
MAAEIVLDTLHIDVEKLEAIPIDLRDPPVCFPMNPLRATGERTTVQTRVAILENDFVRLAVGLDLGGRIVELVDKRTGVAVVPAPASLPLIAGGLRGVRSPHGIPLIVLDGDRPNGMGAVEFSIRPPDEDDDAAELWLFEIVAGFGLGWHQRVTLGPDSAEFEIEVRFSNRTFGATWVALGLAFEGWTVVSRRREPIFGESVLLRSPHGGALGLTFDRRETRVDEEETVTACLHHGVVAPHHAGGAVIRLSPIGSPSARAFSTDTALAVEGPEISVIAGRGPGRCKLFLRDRDDRTLEAEIDLQRGSVARLEAPSHPMALMLRDSEGRTLVEWSDREPRPAPIEWAASDPLGIDEPDAFRRSPPDAEVLIRGRRGGLSSLGAAILAVDRQDWPQAHEELDHALGHLADDPLAWWLKAAVERRAGGGDETPLMNAHYLAPLEPALRAESLLTQEAPEGRGPNPLLSGLADNVEHLIEVACLYLEARLFEEAHRWIDESLRHRDHPLLHYLLAWAYLQRSRMEAEAASEIARARTAALAPPMPWRPFEALVLEDLVARFPDEERPRLLLAGARQARSTIMRLVWPEFS